MDEKIGIEESKALLHKHRIEKLLVVDQDNKLRGLITIKDIQKAIMFPTSTKDEFGRLRVGAGVGVGPDREERVVRASQERCRRHSDRHIPRSLKECHRNGSRYKDEFSRSFR